MENFFNFISLISPNQTPFIGKPIHIAPNVAQSVAKPVSQSICDPLKTTIQQTAQEPLTHWKNSFQLSDKQISAVSLIHNGSRYNLYTSFLYLLCPKYHELFAFNRQMELVEQLIRFLIYQIETNLALKNDLKNSKISANKLIDSIKDPFYQSSQIVFLLAHIFDVNVIIWSIPAHMEIIYHDPQYDTCKPHILLSRDAQSVYHPIVYDQHRVLTYYDQDLIPHLISQKRNQTQVNHF
uniref:Uncharacterized protein n=1 Tax=viral metagenome TaxID=1070528 RepID=A0A6C0BKJ9_9ZZZZ